MVQIHFEKNTAFPFLLNIHDLKVCKLQNYFVFNMFILFVKVLTFIDYWLITTWIPLKDVLSVMLHWVWVFLNMKIKWTNMRGQVYRTQVHNKSHPTITLSDFKKVVNQMGIWCDQSHSRSLWHSAHLYHSCPRLDSTWHSRLSPPVIANCRPCLCLVKCPCSLSLSAAVVVLAATVASWPGWSTNNTYALKHSVNTC